MAGIKAVVPKVMIMGFRETEFEKKDENGVVIEVINSMKVKFHDKISKTDLEVKFSGTIEEFFELGLEEYETYTATLEFTPYAFNNRTNISCKLISVEK